MSKKKKDRRETTIENYYDLKVDKVDELVSALTDENPVFDNDLSMFISDCTGVNDADSTTRKGKQKQFDPYKTDFLGNIPTWIKAIFIKFWFAGMVCYFIMWGISSLDTVDSLVLTGGVLGLIVEILVNPLFRLLESDRKEFNDYMMFPFPFKAFWTFFTNLIYYILVIVCVNYIYFGINTAWNSLSGTVNVIKVGVEPLLFGVFTVIVDMFFIGIKDLFVHLVKRRKKEKAADV